MTTTPEGTSDTQPRPTLQSSASSAMHLACAWKRVAPQQDRRPEVTRPRRTGNFTRWTAPRPKPPVGQRGGLRSGVSACV